MGINNCTISIIVICHFLSTHILNTQYLIE
nr:MAG TPA: hypothetical protein [Caudoviricetes sp.]DAL70132.1 MAG TPA: hypothetical protein [Caudoviricetes sp.]DAP77209.1 MAG TPA: hypothetical protein [Caudoviricetes sp.]DAQ62922.1 MAG TPA: hypothetical protein [Caudoviricetes sp.]